MTNALHADIQKLASTFAAAVVSAIRGANLSDILTLADTRGASTPVPARSGSRRASAKKSVTAAAPVAAPTAASARKTKSGRLKRRSADEIAKALGQIVSLLKSKKAGLRAEQIRAALKMEAKEMPRVLKEGLSIRDLRTILEAVSDAAPRSKDTAFLLDQCRRRMARQITSRLADPAGVVHALTFERATEDTLRSSLAQSEGEAVLNLELETARKLIKNLETRAASLALNGHSVVVLTAPDLRRPVFEFASRFVSDLWVVTARELLPGTTIETAGSLQLSSAT